jgi:cytochrome c biogenesis protein CcdA
MDVVNLLLAYSAGFLATLSPCALPLLPSYISYYLHLGEKPSLKKTVLFAIMVLTGFLTLYIIIGLLPGYIFNQLAGMLDLIVPILGIILIFLGILTGFSNFIVALPMIPLKAPERAGIKSFYLYGLAYGASSLSCSFPVFILLIFQSASTGAALDVVIIFLVYCAGVASLFVPLTLALSFGKGIIYDRFVKYLPYFKKANALIVFLAGVYLILYWIFN